MDSKASLSSTDIENRVNICSVCKEMFYIFPIRLFLLQRLAEFKTCATSSQIMYNKENHTCIKYHDLLEQSLCKECLFFLFAITEEEAYENVNTISIQTCLSITPKCCDKVWESEDETVDRDRNLQSHISNQSLKNDDASQNRGQSSAEISPEESKDSANFKPYSYSNTMEMANANATPMHSSSFEEFVNSEECEKIMDDYFDILAKEWAKIRHLIHQGGFQGLFQVIKDQLDVTL